MRLQAPARSRVYLEFSWDNQLTHTLQVLTRGGELITTLYAKNILNFTGELLLDSASDLVLDAAIVEDIKDWLKEQEAKLQEKRDAAKTASKPRKSREDG